MKKLTALFLCGCLMLSLAACTQGGESSSSTSAPGKNEVSNRSSSTIRKGYSVDVGALTDEEVEKTTWEKDERKALDLTDAANFPKPDRIIYYQPGKTITFEKGTEEYEKVFSLNQARCSGDIGGIQTGMYQWTEFFQSESGLKYEYSMEYYSLFFNLTINDENIVHDFYWIVAPSSNSTVYGMLSEPTELLTYLNSLE